MFDCIVFNAGGPALSSKEPQDGRLSSKGDWMPNLARGKHKRITQDRRKMSRFNSQDFSMHEVEGRRGRRRKALKLAGKHSEY